MSNRAKRMQHLAAAACMASTLTFCNYHEPRTQQPDKGTALTGAGGGPALPRLMEQLFGPNCHGCHNPGRSAGGVDLTSYVAIASGRTAGGAALVTPGDRAASALYRALAEGRMPPSGSVDSNLIEALGCWIDDGATADGGTACFPKDTSANPPPPSGGGAGGANGGTHGGGHHGGHDDDDDRDDHDDHDDDDDDQVGDNGGGGGTTDPVPGVVKFADVQARIFAVACVGCHSGTSAAEGVDLTTRDSILNGSGVSGEGTNGTRMPLVIPGNPDGSLLVQATNGDWMPYFNDPLSAADKALLRDWIKGGAQ